MKNKTTQYFLLGVFSLFSSPFWIIGAVVQFIAQGIRDGYKMSEKFMNWLGK